jgi:hypothetical protein
MVVANGEDLALRRCAPCRLCGSSDEVLSLEHVPPKSTGNRGFVEVQAFAGGPGARLVTPASDGVALRVLCQKCNSKTGSYLGTEFSEFAKQVQHSGRFEARDGRVYVAAVDVFPARIIRQLLLAYLCAQPMDDRPEWDAIRQFIRSRSPGMPEGAPRVSLYYNAAETYKIVPVCGVGSLFSAARQWVGSEIAAPGLGALFSLSDRGSIDADELIGRTTLDISDWANRSFDRRETFAMKLPRLFAQQAHPLGYGDAREFTRWENRRHIVWLVAGAEHEDSITATAAIWRRGRRPRL